MELFTSYIYIYITKLNIHFFQVKDVSVYASFLPEALQAFTTPMPAKG